MTNREQVRELLEKELKRLIDVYKDNPEGGDGINPNYYKNRLKHLDEILGIFIAGKLRRELNYIEKMATWEAVKSYFDRNDGEILTYEDLLRKKIPQTFSNPNVAMVFKEKFFDEFMSEIGEKIPSAKETIRRH